MDPERTPHSLLLGATCLSARCTPRRPRVYLTSRHESLFQAPEENEMKPPDSIARRKFIKRPAPSVGDVASLPIENGTFGAAGTL